MMMIMKMIETSAPVQWESCKHRDDHDDDHRDEGEGGDYVHDHKDRNVCIVQFLKTTSALVQCESYNHDHQDDHEDHDNEKDRNVQFLEILIIIPVQNICCKD